MWIIFLLLPLWALALDPFEPLKDVKLLKVMPDNVVMIDRGVEDGIQRNDHAKLSNEAVGYAARALCIRASASTSYWQLYRVPVAEAISKDYTYSLVGLGGSEIPPHVSRFEVLKKEIQEDSKKKDAGPDPFAVKPDMPEQLTERDLIGATGPEQRKLFIEEVLDRDRLKRDLSSYQFSLYASPFTRQSINDGESLRYGFRGGNVATRYKLLTQFEQQQTHLKDPLTGESVSTRSTTGNAQFVIRQIKRDVSSLSILNYQSTRFSAIGTPKSHWQFGPVGFTWHFYESKSWEYLDLSYVPLYDIRVTEIQRENGDIDTVKENGLRHGLRFAMKSRINERVAFENLLWVRPFQDLSSWEIDAQDLNLVNDLKLVFNLVGNLFFDYNFVYQKDKLWKEINNLPETNIINSLNIRYDFEL